MDKLSLAKKVVANVMDFDMHNLFYPRPLLEEMEDAASGAYTVNDKPYLRERPYGSQPLLIKPTYSGDFLKKLDEPLEGKTLNIEAADEENLKDFSMPSEMLKHQEQPHPRVNLDEYYDFNRPGEGAGGDDLKGYWDRGWDETDAPEMSEDKQMRMWIMPEIGMKIARVVEAYTCDVLGCGREIRASAVVAGYLMDRFPVQGPFDVSVMKTAKTIGDLERSTASKNVGSVATLRLKKKSPREGRYVFETVPSTSNLERINKVKTTPGVGNALSGDHFYTTYIQFVPRSNVRDFRKLDVQVSCDCPSWLYYGAQYNALMGDYLYGNKIWPKVAPPRVRGPGFDVCKHILKAFKFLTEEMGASRAIFIGPKKVKKDFGVSKYELAKPKDYEKEEGKVPFYYDHIDKSPTIQKLVKLWETKPKSAPGILKNLTNVDEVTYFGHKFPEAAHLVAKRLKEIAFAVPKKAKAINKKIKEIEEKAGEEPEKLLAVPVELSHYDNTPSLQDTLKKLKLNDRTGIEAYVQSQKDPDMVAYLYYKFFDKTDPGKWFLTNAALNEITQLAKFRKDTPPEIKEKARHWLSQMIGMGK